MPQHQRAYPFQVSKVETTQNLRQTESSFQGNLYHWITSGHRLPLPWPDYRPTRPLHANEVSEVTAYFESFRKRQYFIGPLLQIILSCWGELPEERQTFPYMKGVFERLITKEELQRAQQAVELETRQYAKVRRTLAREEDEQAYEPMGSPEIIESGGAPTLCAGRPIDAVLEESANVMGASSTPTDSRGYVPHDFVLAGNESRNLFAASWV